MSGDDVLNFCSLVVAVAAVMAIRFFTELRSRRVTIVVFLAVFLLFRCRGGPLAGKLRRAMPSGIVHRTIE